MTRRLSVALALAGAAATLGCVAAPAYAEAPAWTISSVSSPTNFRAGDETGDDMYVLTVVDTGEGPATGASPIAVTDTLPNGLTASGISGEDLGNGQALTCGLTPTLGCTYEGFEVAPGDVLRIEMAVKVSPGVPSSVVNKATVAGGGAEAGASIEDPTTISSTGAGFGVSDFAAAWSGTQAGASVNLTTGFTFNQVVTGGGETVPAADAKEVALNLPPGFVANPTALPECTAIQAEGDACPKGAAVGVAFVSTNSGVGGAPAPYSSLVYNASPSPGEPGALVLFLPSGPVWLELTLRTDGDYGLRVAASDLSQVDALISMTLTLWGDPGADDGFGPGPDHVIAGGAPSFGSAGGSQARFLASAGTCSGALPDSTLSADSWAAPAVFAEAASTTPALTGCDRLPFDPSLSVAPDVIEADTPSGYELDLKVPQPEDPGGLASAELKEAAVTLPEGVGISLSAADGLQACTEAQVGLGSSAAVTCPNASKIGTVEIHTPLLVNPLEGAVFLAAPSENPFASPLAVYIVAEDPVAGVRIKLPGQIEADQLTGRLTIVLGELPQLPISGLELRFFGGARALLSTPPTCGLATSTSALTPWSGAPAAAPSSSFEIDAGMDGEACSAAQPFDPTFQTGSTTAGEADAYGSLSLFVSRTAQEQQLGAIAIQAPRAVQEMFAGVPACGEPQASEGACPQTSEVGTVAAQAGVGSYPADLNGEIYLTGAYGGATQGLEIVLPVEPGPLKLGDAIVRASAQIEPGTGRLRIATGRLPSFVDGASLQLKALLLRLDRDPLRISPDGCESLTVTGTITSAQGGSVTIATEPFGAAWSPCPPAPAPAPAATPGAAVSVGGVSLDSTRIATARDGKAAVKLSCTGASTCRGRLTLTVTARGRKTRNGHRASKTETIATAAFSIPADKTATVKLTLNVAGRALLGAHHGRLSASLTVVKSVPVPAQTQTERVQLVLQKVHGKAKK